MQSITNQIAVYFDEDLFPPGTPGKAHMLEQVKTYCLEQYGGPSPNDIQVKPYKTIKGLVKLHELPYLEIKDAVLEEFGWLRTVRDASWVERLLGHNYYVSENIKKSGIVVIVVDSTVHETSDLANQFSTLGSDNELIRFVIIDVAFSNLTPL